MMVIEHTTIKEDDEWVFGITKHDGQFVTNWCRLKRDGIPFISFPEIGYPPKVKPANPSPEYLAATLRWPIKDEYINDYWGK